MRDTRGSQRGPLALSHTLACGQGNRCPSSLTLVSRFFRFGVWSAAVLCSAAFVSLFCLFLPYSLAPERAGQPKPNQSGGVKHCRTPNKRAQGWSLPTEHAPRFLGS